MPNYEFWCKDCEGIEVLKGIKHEDRPKSIKCKCGKKMKPAISGDIGDMFPQGRCKGGYFRPHDGGRRYQKFF